MLKQKVRAKRMLKTAALVAVAGIPVVLASVPRSQEIANDTAIYQNLHEINVKKVKSIDFDSDIEKLSAQEKSHRLPLRLSEPMKRVLETPYQSGPKRNSKSPSRSRFKK